MTFGNNPETFNVVDPPSTAVYRYTGRRAIFNAPGYPTDSTPCSFAQGYKSIVFPMQSEGSSHKCSTTAPSSCDDGIQPGNSFDSDAPTFYDGSWKGGCVKTRDPDYTLCTMFIRINGIDIEQHITGDGCPSDFQGKKRGLIKVISRRKMIPVTDAGQNVLLVFSEIVIKWIYGGTPYEAGEWIKCILSTGVDTFRSPDDHLKIVCSEPRSAFWPVGEIFIRSDLPGCTLSELRPVHFDAEFSLPPLLRTNEIIKSKALKHQRITEEIDAVVSCNNSLADIYELRRVSAACEALVTTLLMKDPLQMVPSYFSGQLCKSRCRAEFELAVGSAHDICRQKWNQIWEVKEYQAILFKQLLTVASLKYRLYLDCASNRDLQTCITAASFVLTSSIRMDGEAYSYCTAYQVVLGMFPFLLALFLKGSLLISHINRILTPCHKLIAVVVLINTAQTAAPSPSFFV